MENDTVRYLENCPSEALTEHDLAALKRRGKSVKTFLGFDALLAVSVVLILYLVVDIAPWIIGIIFLAECSGLGMLFITFHQAILSKIHKDIGGGIKKIVRGKVSAKGLYADEEDLETEPARGFYLLIDDTLKLRTDDWNYESFAVGDTIEAMVSPQSMVTLDISKTS